MKKVFTKSLFPMKCSQPKMLTKKRIAGMLQVIAIITITYDKTNIWVNKWKSCVLT